MQDFQNPPALAVEARTTGDGAFLLARSIFLLSENNMYFGHFDSESIWIPQ